MVSIEQHVEWIADAMSWLQDHKKSTLEATIDAEDEWTAHVDEVGRMTLYLEANSWYMGANVVGKARVFMPYVGGVGAYRGVCDWVAADGYSGFVTA